MLKNIKMVKRSDPPCFNTFCKWISEILKARIPCSTELLFVALWKIGEHMNLILGEMIIEKPVHTGAINKVILRTGKNKFNFIFSFYSFPKVLH